MSDEPKASDWDQVCEAFKHEALSREQRIAYERVLRAEARALAREKAAEAAEQARVYQLAFWPEGDRAMPGDFIACALFSISRCTEHVTSAQLASINGLTVIFTGKRLNQVHADVWLGIMHLARHQSEGAVIWFSVRQLLELIGRHTHQTQRQQVIDAIRELQATSVVIQDDKKRKRFGGSLLPEHEESDASEHAAGSVFRVKINRALAKLLSADIWMIDWTVRRKLQNKPLALWLQTYFARFTRAPSVAQLHALSGSGAELKKFRFSLVKALADLHAAGGHSAELDRESDTVIEYLRPLRPPKRGANDGGQKVLPFVRPK